MRRIAWTAAIVLCVTLIMTACGKKDAESVVKELDKFMNSMESYQGSGTMTLHSGQQPQTYLVDVSFQKPRSYRIKLTNEEKDVTQIVLRNDDGVFVLTPKLNKVFRFQSDWPQNHGQVYLYQTLVQSILTDGSRQFEVGDDAFVFDVMANYNNNSFSRQKIWLSKDDYKPIQVEVNDTNSNVMVDVKFTSFTFGPKFDASVFDTEANMKQGSEGATGEQPTMTTPESGTGKEHEAATDQTETDNAELLPGDNGSEESSVTEEQEAEGGDDEGATTPTDNKQGETPVTSRGFIAMGPDYLPEGVAAAESSDIVFGGNEGMMTKYKGTYNYVLIQTQPQDIAASQVPGILYDLGFTIAEMVSGDAMKTLTWTYEGQQFRLSSADSPDNEILKIAQSVQGMMSK